MSNFLHSLPWTLALALAQTGEGIPTPLPDSTDALQATESEMLDRDGTNPPVTLRLSEADAESGEAAGSV